MLQALQEAELVRRHSLDALTVFLRGGLGHEILAHTAMNSGQRGVFCQPVLIARTIGQQLSQDVITHAARLL